MRQFSVKASDEKPPPPSGYNVAFDPQYLFCGQYADVVEVSSSAKVTCVDNNAVGRYVFVHVEKKNHLSFCECHVYGVICKNGWIENYCMSQLSQKK